MIKTIKITAVILLLAGILPVSGFAIKPETGKSNAEKRDTTKIDETFLPPKNIKKPDAVYTPKKLKNIPKPQVKTPAAPDVKSPKSPATESPKAVPVKNIKKLESKKIVPVKGKFKPTPQETELYTPDDFGQDTFLENEYGYLIGPNDSARCIADLVRDLDRIVKGIGNSKISLSVYSLDQEKYIYERNIDAPLTPASNTKLVTSFCAFERFGSDYTVKTKIYIDDKNISDSIVNGNLIIEGYGDALLKITDLEFLADQIKSLGIKKITGNIYADGTYFDSITDRPEYAGDDDEVEKLPPVVALGLERNKANVVVTSGSRAGVPVNVQIIPESESFLRSVSAKVRAYRHGEILQDEEKESNEALPEDIDYRRAGDELIALNSASAIERRTCRIISKWDGKNEKQIFTVSGYLYPNKTFSRRYYIMEPELAVAGTLKDRLIAGGVEVEGNIAYISEKNDAKKEFYLLCEFGRDIKHFLNPIGRNSDNYLAETMFKMLGASADYSDTTAVSTRKLQSEILASYGIPFKGCLLNDGSGLSRRNLLTTRTITELLISAYYADFYPHFLNSLAIAGRGKGTLRKRMKMTAAEDNLRAKTGTLRNVSALSGYVTSIDGERFVFSMLSNGWSVGTYKNAENEIGNLLASFFYYNEQN